MFYQLKPAFGPIPDTPDSNTPWVEVLTRKEVEQRTDTAEIPFLERSLVHSHNCKAELLENCAAGTVLIPRKERHGSEVAFAFWLTGERLTFVDDSGQVANLLEQFSQQPGLVPSSGELLLEFLEFLIQDDAAFLQHLEAQLDKLEEQLLER